MDDKDNTRIDKTIQISDNIRTGVRPGNKDGVENKVGMSLRTSHNGY